MAMPASSRTTSRSSVSPISSSRISRAVSGVRSWCEASAAKSRSEASDRVSCWALRASTSETASISAMPETSGSSRDCPAPSRSARSASPVIGSANLRAWREATSTPTATAITESTTIAARIMRIWPECRWEFSHSRRTCASSATPYHAARNSGRPTMMTDRTTASTVDRTRR